MTHLGSGAPVGCQTLAILDVESQYILDNWIAEHKPTAFTADEIIGFITKVFTKYGQPSEGLLISDSAWRSSQALYDDEITHDRVAEAVSWGLSWPEMQESERLKVDLHIQSLGISLAWDGDDIQNIERLIG